MYLAHELIILGMKMNLSSVLPDTVKVTFVDFIEPLKSLGCSVLECQMETQQEQIFKILSDSGNVIPPTLSLMVTDSLSTCYNLLLQDYQQWASVRNCQFLLRNR